MVAVDSRGPKYDGGIVTRIDAIPLGIAVNRQGERFYDEGEDIWPKRYAIWGHLIAQQEGQTAFAIIDSSMLGKFMPTAFEPIQANTIEEMADKIGVSRTGLKKTVEYYNGSSEGKMIKCDGSFESTAKDLNPRKSHFYKPLNEPPFYAYPLSPGLTFTYMGVEVDRQARVLGESGPMNNVFAAGEIMSGNILKSGYLAGFGLTIGTVFGRIAGQEAALA